MRWERHVIRMGEKLNKLKISVENCEGNNHLVNFGINDRIILK
jgi:hypothetical protein